MAVVVVNIVFPCPSGSSCTDWRASAKAMAPLSPVSPKVTVSFIKVNHIQYKIIIVMALTAKPKCFLML